MSDQSLKFENTAEIGDTIRAYDFEPSEGRDDKYVEGVVTAKGWNQYYKCYSIEVTKDTVYCKHTRTTVFVPFGISMMDFDERVTLIERKDD